MSLSHTDQIAPKVIENDVVVPAGLQVGEMTLQEHQDYLKWQKMQRPLTRHEAIAAGHRPNEVYAYFGPLDVKHDEVISPAQAKETVVHLTMSKVEAYVDVPKVIEHIKYIEHKAEPTTDDQYATSVARGYTGDACPDCGSFTMIHNGTCLVCDNCGRTTGCS